MLCKFRYLDSVPLQKMHNEVVVPKVLFLLNQSGCLFFLYVWFRSSFEVYKGMSGSWQQPLVSPLSGFSAHVQFLHTESAGGQTQLEMVAGQYGVCQCRLE